jgi:hypothetical protein
MRNERSRDPNKKRSEWFSDGARFVSLLSALEESPHGPKVTLPVVYGGTVEGSEINYNHFFIATPHKCPMSSKIVQGGSNYKSWLYALAIAKNTPMCESYPVYLLENDYLHVDGWLDKISQIDAPCIPFDYLALYDHADKYFLDIYDNSRSRILVTKTQHWRTAPSTCGTFIMPRRVFLEDIGDWAQEITD